MSLSAPDPSTVTTGFDGPKEPVLFDRYRILGILGQGGMGTVYRGFHINLKRPVAIKTLRLDRLERAGAVPRFLREMELAGQLDHRHIVRTTDGGESNGIYYLVMEYLEGRDLEQIVRRVGKLGVADACELARQAAVGLAYAHEKLIHRDIKPSNLWLTPAGVVKILDLGLARCHEVQRLGEPGNEETPVGAVIGTYDFLAPEQAAGRDVDCRTDLYSLGCTLYKLIIGNSPYSGPGYSTPAEKMHAHLRVPLEQAPSFCDLPAEVLPIIERLMAKEPADRYPNAQEAAQALAGLARTSQVANLVVDQPADLVLPLPLALPDDLSRLTVEAQRTPVNTDARAPAASTVTPPAPPTRRRMLVLAAAAGAALVLVGLIFFLWNPRPTGPVALNELESFKYHVLMKQKPLGIGIREEDRQRWRWHERDAILEVKGPGALFFPLGATTRSRWTFEVNVAQLPWTGDCGIFWGLTRDAAVEKSRTSGAALGQCQILLLQRTPGPDNVDQFSIRRGIATLKIDSAGALFLERTLTNRNDVAAPAFAEKVLSISVEQFRLRQAHFGGDELTRLTSQTANASHKGDAVAGELGVFAINHSTTFSNARFKASSED